MKKIDVFFAVGNGISLLMVLCLALQSLAQGHLPGIRGDQQFLLLLERIFIQILPITGLIYAVGRRIQLKFQSDFKWTYWQYGALYVPFAYWVVFMGLVFLYME